jgi:6-pyruvoyltetrahydropterin/6-carboxytetrahydropterin synthase
MTSITRKIEFDAGHRVLGHEGKCRHLHGHHYVAEVTVEGAELDSLGRVIDFSILKQRVGGWIDENWDHNFLVHPEDPLRTIRTGKVFAGRELYVMLNGNPTAENMAAELFEVATMLLPELKVTHVRLYETPNCWADCEG